MDKNYRLNTSFAYKEFCHACSVNVRAIKVHRDGSATVQVAPKSVQRLQLAGAEVVREWRESDFTVQIRINTVAPYDVTVKRSVGSSSTSARQAEDSFEKRMQAKQREKVRRLLAEMEEAKK